MLQVFGHLPRIQDRGAGPHNVPFVTVIAFEEPQRVVTSEEAPIVSISGEISVKVFGVGLRTRDCFERTEIGLHGREARHEDSPRMRQELYFLSRLEQLFVALGGCVASVCGDVMHGDSHGHNFSEIGKVEVQPFVNGTYAAVAPVPISRVLAASERVACLHADDLI